MSTYSSDRSQDENNSRRHLSPGNSRSRSHSPRKSQLISKRVVVANIPYDMDWPKLKELFRERVGFSGYLQMFKSNGKPTGIGVMEFKTLEGAEKAIEAMHRYEIGDRKLVVREETPRDRERFARMELEDQNPVGQTGLHKLERPLMAPMQPLINPQLLNKLGIEGPVTDSVYVSNLDFSVTWQKLKDMFKLAGRVLNVDLKTNSEGNSRGTAIVRYSNAFEAVQAVNMFNGQRFMNRSMRVKIDKQGTPAPVHPPFPGDNSGILGNMNSTGGFPPPPFLPPPPPPPNPHQATAMMTALATLMGLKFNADQPRGANLTDILQSMNPNTPSGPGNFAFRGAGTSPTRGRSPAFNALNQLLSITSNSNANRNPGSFGSGMDRWDGFRGPQDAPGLPANMDALQELLAAASACGMPPGEIESALSQLGLGQSSRVFPQPVGVPSPMPRVGGPPGAPNFSDSVTKSRIQSQPPQQGHISRPDQPRFDGNTFPATMPPDDQSRKLGKVVVKNLPFSLTWQDVRKAFREIGEIRFCNMPTDAQGRSQGTAFLNFVNPEDNRRAVARFDGTMVEGRRIKVFTE